MRLSNEVVDQLARVRCSECGKPSIYADDAFFAHYEAHLGEREWNTPQENEEKIRMAWMKRFQPVRYYTEYAYREEGWR